MNLQINKSAKGKWTWPEHVRNLLLRFKKSYYVCVSMCVRSHTKKPESVRRNKCTVTQWDIILFQNGRHCPQALILVNFTIYHITVRSEAVIRESDSTPSHSDSLSQGACLLSQWGDNTDGLGASIERRNQQFNGPDFSELPSDLKSTPLLFSWWIIPAVLHVLAYLQHFIHTLHLRRSFYKPPFKKCECTVFYLPSHTTIFCISAGLDYI